MRIPSHNASLYVAIICLPNFNALATFAFIDPLRIANYLSGTTLYRWKLYSLHGGMIGASNGTALQTVRLDNLKDANSIIVSSSWTPEAYRDPTLLKKIRIAASRGTFVAGLDTGGFILAEAGLLDGRKATVHYEHIDAFIEQYPEVRVVENKFVMDAETGTCCGGSAATDFALHLIRQTAGAELTNAAARYMFHDRIRLGDSQQNPRAGEPLGFSVPAKLREAIQLMEQNLEEPISIAEIADAVGISQRQLARLFRENTDTSVVRYYTNARLDRARGLITQTSIAITQVAVASGFPSPEHFSRVYKRRFGLSPSADRIEGRIPFEYRAWPMHSVRT